MPLAPASAEARASSTASRSLKPTPAVTGEPQKEPPKDPAPSVEALKHQFVEGRRHAAEIEYE